MSHEEKYNQSDAMHGESVRPEDDDDKEAEVTTQNTVSYLFNYYYYDYHLAMFDLHPSCAKRNKEREREGGGNLLSKIL